MVPYPRGERPWRDRANSSRPCVNPLRAVCTRVVWDADLRGCCADVRAESMIAGPVVQVSPAEAIDD